MVLQIHASGKQIRQQVESLAPERTDPVLNKFSTKSLCFTVVGDEFIRESQMLRLMTSVTGIGTTITRQDVTTFNEKPTIESKVYIVFEQAEELRTLLFDDPQEALDGDGFGEECLQAMY